MYQSTFCLTKSKANLILCLVIILSIGFGCANIRHPWRDYSAKPFNSAEWLAGDAIERGRMYGDIFEKNLLEGKSKDAVVKLLGEPDKKATVEDREVWLYRIENRFHNRLNQFPVTFENKKGAFAGGVKGGTVSMIVDEEWANQTERQKL